MFLPEFVFRFLQRSVKFERGSHSFQPRLNSGLGLSRLASLPLAMGVAVMLAGCGETYRPVVAPVAVTGPLRNSAG